MSNKNNIPWKSFGGAKWAHYMDLPESEMSVDGFDEWSERFSGWWQVSDIFGSKTISTTVGVLGPGEKTPMHAHRNPIEEYYVVIEGATDFEVKDPETGDVELIEGATPGTVAYFPPGIEHRPANNYDEPTIELGFRRLEGSIEASRESIQIGEKPKTPTDKKFQWSHYRDLPKSKFEHQDGGKWSERFSGWWQVSEIFGSETISVTVVEIGPDEETPMHSHRTPVEEYYICLEGKVDLEIKDPKTGEVELIEGATPGTIAYFPPGVEHRPINNYDEPTVEIGWRSLEAGFDALDENVNYSYG